MSLFISPQVSKRALPFLVKRNFIQIPTIISLLEPGEVRLFFFGPFLLDSTKNLTSNLPGQIFRNKRIHKNKEIKQLV